ncbi:hypothetical protein ACOMHN_066432 [Nucella lapillus]
MHPRLDAAHWGEDVSQWALVGKEMGLRGEALGRFVTDSIRNAELKEERREEMRRKARREEEDKFRLDEELRLKKRRDDEELRLKKRREEEDKFRLDEELRLKKRRDDEELKLRREEVDSNRDFHGRRLENDETRNIKIAPLGENDDVDAFVAHFEQITGLCKLDAEAYRKRFRNMRKEVSETFEQALTRMKRWFSLWCSAAGKDETDVGDVTDLLLQEQMYKMFNVEFTVEVRRTCPKTVDEVAKEATVFAEAKWMGKEERLDRDYAQKQKEAREGKRLPDTGQPTAGQPTVLTGQDNPTTKSARPGPTYPRSQIVCFKCHKQGHTQRECRDKIMAVKAHEQVGCGGGGHRLTFPEGPIEVLIMKQPVVEVLISNFAKRQGAGTWTSVPVYSDRELIAPVQTRAQRLRATGGLPDLSIKTHVLGTTRDKLVAFQEGDGSLRKVREAFQKRERLATKTGLVWYVKKGGVLMRQHQCKDDTMTQVVVPKELRLSVMTLGHDIPMAGHLGTRKTKDRIFLEFYWPGMCGDIRRYCQSCVRCQRTVNKGRVPRAPMVKMPLAAEPFSRVGMDIIGPMNPMSEGGYRVS